MNSFAQGGHVEFIENKGQWNNNVRYKAEIPSGNLYLENNKLTYQFYNEEDLAKIDDLHHGFFKNPTHKDSIINIHAFNVKFLNSLTPNFSAETPRPDYVNYFVGNDKSKWASNVKKYEEINYQNLYANIGLKFYLKDNFLKYDFNVLPGGNPKDIKLNYNGIADIYIKDENLYLITSVNTIIEQKPYAYQIINGKEKEVKCKFKLKDGILSFSFPNGFKKSTPLIIDPTLIFASYSGATVDNWGYTSTFNEAGNLYGGGISFGVGYPVTTGAYQISFSGGTHDISITKFSPNGSSLIYSTYLGGSASDYPHSLIVNSNDELLIFGTTSSIDFPTTINAYDTSQNGGFDIFVSKLSSNGASLLSSTYIGDTLNDGLNSTTPLKYNYADDFRGEIILDATDNICVASTTKSVNFPTTAGVVQPISRGQQDACVFKLSADLSTLMWSTYLGGDSTDAAYSLQFDQNGNILVTGGTVSSNFPTTPGTVQPSFQGYADGWITKLNNNATSIMASTYVGTSDYDQTFFVQLDTANNVYVVGQTEGTYPITPPTVYNNPNSGQFLHKFSPDLASTIFSTTFGTSSGEVDIALSAFLVNECNYILVSGWGGLVNYSYSMATSSTTNGLPVTANAIQPTTDGDDYYLAMFSEDADTILFATFFGGNSSPDHVDGGTSRFDKKGIVYQAVCASCFGATSDFPTTPGAWSNFDNGPNCNLGVFKIDLTRLTADAEVYTTPYYCAGDTVHFQNLSNGGISYFWDFGDGDTSTLFEPSHVFDTAGTFSVMLIALDSISCINQDTDYVDVFIGGPPLTIITPANGICRGDSMQLGIMGGLSHLWSPNYNLSNDTSSTPFVWPDSTTTYTVITSDSCGADTSVVIVTVYQKNITISPDTIICLGQGTPLSVSGGNSYLWSPAASLDNANSPTPIATPLSNTTYNVTIINSNLCSWDTSLTVLVDTFPPNPVASPTAFICLGDSVEIYATGNRNFSWSPTNSLRNPYDSISMAIPIQTTNYTVSVTNACGIDTTHVIVNVHTVLANIVQDTMVCIGSRANLWATGGTSYLWYNSNGVYSTDSVLNITIYDTITFYVDITDATNCSTTLSVFVDTLANPVLELGEDIEANWGSLVTLSPTTNGVSFSWSPPTGLSCTNCQNPVVTATETSTYYLTLEGSNGCFNYDTITITYDGSIYVPNSFSPNGNGDNDIFYVYGKDIVEFELSIFDRWGEKLFYSNDMNIGWDGTYKGTLAKTETYVWKVTYKDILGDPGTLYGTVTLIR